MYILTVLHIGMPVEGDSVGHRVAVARVVAARNEGTQRAGSTAHTGSFPLTICRDGL
jgi:hypothetical protein